MRLETIAIHAGGDVDPATGSVSAPIRTPEDLLRLSWLLFRRFGYTSAARNLPAGSTRTPSSTKSRVPSRTTW